MFNNRIADMLRNEVAIEWHGTNDGDAIEETVTFANGCELELRLEFPEPEEMENDEAVYYMGEDVRASIYGASKDLFNKFGEDRVHLND